jgi:peptidoglycan-associated lipoprotein
MTNTQNPIPAGSSPAGKLNPAMTGPNNDKATMVGSGGGSSRVPGLAGGGHTPAIKVTQINFREIGIVIGAVVFIGGLIAGYWFYTQQDKTHAGGVITFSQDDKRPSLASTSKPPVTMPGNLVPGALTPPPVAISKQTSPIPAAEAVHADIYFDFDRSRLRADAVAILQEKAEVLKKEGNWAVLVQGYADQHGPTEYNKGLALRRAQAVKQFLVELGVPQAAIKVVTIGKEGMICDDQSKECQQLNRRVHLEIMKVGSPSVSLTPAPPTVAKRENETSSPVQPLVGSGGGSSRTGPPPAINENLDITDDSDTSDNEVDDLLNSESENDPTQTH